MTTPAVGPRPQGEVHPPFLAFAVDAPSVAPEQFLRRAVRSFPESEPVGHLWAPPGGMQAAGWGAARYLNVDSNPPVGVRGSRANGGRQPSSSGAPEAIERVVERASRLFGGLVGAEEVPARLYGGLAFDPEPGFSRPVDPGWEDYGAGSFVLPRIGYSRDESGAYLYGIVDGADAGSEVLERLRRLAGWLDRDDLPDVDGPTGNGRPGKLPGAGGQLAPLPEILQASDKPSASDWLRQVGELRREVSGGRLQKVVAARTVELELARTFDVDDLARIAGRLRVHMPTCTTFAFLRGGSIFFGATPELLVRRHGRDVESQALAGSIASDPSPARQRGLERELLASQKDRLEHELVVRHLVERLDRTCGAVAHPSSPGVRVLRNVLHLETPVRAALAESEEPPHVLRLVRALHPTPAVAGRPTASALAVIRQAEALGRGWYAGPVGWFDSSGDGEFSVALRSCLASGRKGRLYSGNGIVADSDPAGELAETNLKLDAILGAWG